VWWYTVDVNAMMILIYYYNAKLMHQQHAAATITMHDGLRDIFSRSFLFVLFWQASAHSFTFPSLSLVFYTSLSRYFVFCVQIERLPIFFLMRLFANKSPVVFYHHDHYRSHEYVSLLVNLKLNINK
jgi:hypothetical protein